MENYFGITYLFGREQVQNQIDGLVRSGSKGYICVADGVTLVTRRGNSLLSQALNQSVFNTCDSGWVPSYLRLLYGIEREQYTGSDLLEDIVRKQQYRMMFLGSSDEVLQALKNKLAEVDERVTSMSFASLPFKSVDGFDYQEIANQIREEDPDIIWISLGMPKQEIFMNRLEPFLNRGILIGVGAAFKFHSGLLGHNRAPRWMIRCKLEWLHRIFSEPRKQIGRCWLILTTMPVIFFEEYRYKRR